MPCSSSRNNTGLTTSFQTLQRGTGAHDNLAAFSTLLGGLERGDEKMLDQLDKQLDNGDDSVQNPSAPSTSALASAQSQPQTHPATSVSFVRERTKCDLPEREDNTTAGQESHAACQKASEDSSTRRDPPDSLGDSKRYTGHKRMSTCDAECEHKRDIGSRCDVDRRRNCGSQQRN